MRGYAHAAAALSFVFIHRHTLDITVVRNGEYYVLYLNQIFDIYIRIVIGDFAATFVIVLVFDFKKFGLDYLNHSLRFCEYIAQIFNHLFKLCKLFLYLLDFECGKSLQSHFKYCNSLLIRKLKVVHKIFDSRLPIAGFLYRVNDLVYVGQSLDQAQQYMFSLQSLIKVILRSSDNDVLLVLDVLFKYLFEIEHLRRTFDKRKHYHRMRYLQLRMFVKHIEHDLRIGVFFDVDDYSHTVLIRKFVYVGDALYFLLLDKVRHILNESCLVDLIRYLRDGYLRFAAVFVFLYLCLSSYDAVASAGAVRFLYSASAHDIRSRRIVGRRDIFHKSVYVYLRVFKQRNRTVNNFAKIVRRYRRSHTYCDTVGAVDKQVGES